jgi:hypothetical protein
MASKEEKVKGPQDVPDVVALHIASVMRDTKAMKTMEGELDRFLATLTVDMAEDDRKEAKNKVRQQLTNGRLVLESLLNRALTSIG